MRSYKNISRLIFAGAIVFASCSKDKNFLTEEQKDALNPGIAYRTKAQFDVLLASNYQALQKIYASVDGPNDAWVLGLGTDVMSDPRDNANAYNNWALVTPVDRMSNDWYNLQYFTIIKVANTVLSAADLPTTVWVNDAEKNATLAEARFFRAFAYRNLANVFGGVPIIDKAITEPKVDFKRNTREECWAFAKADLEFARLNLPLTAPTRPGKVLRAAADHLLSEINICLKDWDGAIAAATRVIDGTDGTYSLVKARFGARSTETNKDYYWDLFVMGNQNTQAGNNEGILVAQFEVGPTGAVIPGGVTTFTRPLIERTMWCSFWGQAKFGYGSLAKDSTGRGVGFVRGNSYALYDIWQNSGTDMRNNEINIKRNYYFGPTTPASTGYLPGQLIPKSFLTAREDTMQYIYPNWQKFGTDKHILAAPDNGYVRDFYVMRLPETYLLRAEAYLGKARTDLAAADINVVRDRAKATPVAAANVTLDYILDERARELFGEEFRMLTLGRLGLIYDRTKKYGLPAAQASIKLYNNLFPIPQREIDTNTGAVLEQNDGYNK